jgi:hypothetical protein
MVRAWRDKHMSKAQSPLRVSITKFSTLFPEDEYPVCGRKQIKRAIQSR